MEDQTNDTDARPVAVRWDGLDHDDFDDFGSSSSDELRLFADLPSETVVDQPASVGVAENSTPPRRSGGRNAALVIAGIVGVLVVAAALGESFISPSATVTSTVSAIVLPATPVLDEDFERADSSAGLGMTPQNRRWDVVLGKWGIDRGAAYISQPNGVGALRNMAFVDLGSSDGSIAATVSGRGVCGVMIRYLDPFNFITLKRVSLFGVWNLEKIVGGETSLLTFLADPPTPTVDIRVDFRGSQLDVFVAGASVTVNDTAGQTSSLVGLLGEQIDSRDCRWSAFRAWNVGGDV